MKPQYAYSVFTLVACFPLYSQQEIQFKQGDEPLQQEVVPSYNSPASVKLKEGYNVFLTASYLYWYAGEGGLDLATTAAYLSNTNVIIPSSNEGRTIFQDFDYSSGFKIGLGGGWCPDGWVLRLDYTRFHHEINTSESAPSAGNGLGALYFTDWFIQVSSQGQTLAASKLSSTWNLKLDWLDLVLQRAFYSGRRMIFIPFIGLRSSWINQSLDIDAKFPLNVTPPSTTLSSDNKQNSWGIGPRGGISGYLLLYSGLRMQAELGASVLYTHYSSIKHTEDPFTSGSSTISYNMNDYNCLRPMAEANLGLGWGMYFKKQRYHLDLSATYDFNYLWSQNMMRTLNDLQIIGTNGAANDLYLHGLTVSCTFNF